MDPLYILYRKGPNLNGVGFWCGKSNEEICSILTNSEYRLWERNSLDCMDIIQRHYEAFAITVYTLLCVTFLYKSISSYITYVTIIRPIQRTIELSQFSKCE